MTLCTSISMFEILGGFKFYEMLVLCQKCRTWDKDTSTCVFRFKLNLISVVVKLTVIFRKCIQILGSVSSILSDRRMCIFCFKLNFSVLVKCKKERNETRVDLSVELHWVSNYLCTIVFQALNVTSENFIQFQSAGINNLNKRCVVHIR